MAATHADPTESTPEQRMLRGSATPDFLDFSHEWRRLFAETWDTFLLVVVAAGAGVGGAPERRGDNPEYEGNRTGHDGHGDHPFHGRRWGRPS
jgi:hypothetical protein